MMWFIAAGVALLALILAMQVDSWSRDLIFNSANTAPDARDELLQPLTVSLSPEDAEELVQSAAARLARWELVASDRAGAESAISLHYVRTSGWLRIKDDVTVIIQPHDTEPNHEMDAPHVSGATIQMHSQSPVGGGDLGRNPRNIKELMRAIRERL
jgi:uncharacterized protein (DUF1499 family)